MILSVTVILGALSGHDRRLDDVAVIPGSRILLNVARFMNLSFLKV